MSAFDKFKSKVNSKIDEAKLKIKEMGNENREDDKEDGDNVGTVESDRSQPFTPSGQQ
jgi:hypothetical protein